jgi:predicted nucleotidyltransferase
MADIEIVEKAARLLLEAAPGSRVILFGSCVRDEADPHSDIDFLVIEPEVKDRHAEMVRLRRVLRPLRIPVDVLVTSTEAFEEWRDTPNTVIYEAAREGRVYEQVA